MAERPQPEEIRLSAGILAVPERAHYVVGLLAHLGEDADRYNVQVYWDDDHRGLWWNARRLWEATPPGCTHRVLLQDDISICADFMASVEAVVRARPAAAISLFCYGPEQDRVHAAGRHWMRWAYPVGCAQLLPAAWAQEFVAWADSLDSIPVQALARVGPKQYQQADDTTLLHWLELTGRPAFVTVPGLVRHLGWHESVFLREPRGPMTQHELYIGHGQSGLAIAWGVEDE